MAAINDVVLVYLEDTPVSFARVEDITPDVIVAGTCWCDSKSA